jgi:hypothetical protein
MICDLLARAGISARVDGEFLAGAGGELPLGSSIKVRVDPSRATEAREVIDEWQRHQPPPEPMPPPPRSSWLLPLWFVGGAIIGGMLMVAVLRSPVTRDSADFNGDGIADEFYYYKGQVLDRVELDRNADGKIDGRWLNDYRGIPSLWEGDDDFDGHFEWKGEVRGGSIVSTVKDVNADGKPEQVVHFTHGVLRHLDIYDAGHLVARETYDNSRLMSREYDKDGDGTFERHVEFDVLGEPVASQD